MESWSPAAKSLRPRKESPSQQRVTFDDAASASARTETSSGPNWHAFGMLVTWSGAGLVTLLSYIWEVAPVLDTPQLALIIIWLLWLLWLLLLARASVLRTNLWNVLGPTSLFAAWGIVAPLMLWGVGSELQLMRGYPVIEAIIVSGVNIYLSVLPMGGVIVQHALFISVASLERWARTPSTEVKTAAMNLMVMAANFALGIPACCLLSLAHNRRTTLASPSAAATAAAAAAAVVTAGEDTDTQATNNKRLTSAQPSVLPKVESKGSEGQGSSSASLLGAGQAISPPIQNMEPSGQPAPSGLMLLLASICRNASLVAWVQRIELWLLAAISKEDAMFLTAMLSAVFVSARFMAQVAIYTVPSTVAVCLSPTMDMLGLVLGILVGTSKVPDLKGWADAQYRSYRSVRGLLRSIIPAHVADALEAYEAERELARTADDAFSEASGEMLHRQSSEDNGRWTSFSAFVGATWAQPSSHSRKSSDAASVGLAKLFPGPSHPWEWATRTWSGNVRGCLPSLRQSAQTRSACHPASGSHPLERCNSHSEHGNKMSLDRQRSFSERHDQVTVLFADIVGFTDLSDQLHPSEVMTLLCDLYKEYDELAEKLELYNVDVIGDCYMCAANLIKPLPNHMSIMVEFARNIISIANVTLSPLGSPLSIRVGIHTGPLMSGVVGEHRLKFTLLGQTVNLASRMESNGIPNTIQISEDAYKQLQREQVGMSPEAEGGKGLDGGECDYWVPMHGQEQNGRHVDGANNAPPWLLGSMHKERGAALSELRCCNGSMRDQGSKSQQQQGQGQQCQLQQEQEQPSWEQQPQQQQQRQWQQQQCFCEQPNAKRGGQDRLHEPQSMGEECEGFATVPEEQSSRTQQLRGMDAEPERTGCWIERKLDVKGKGTMKAYLYNGPCQRSSLQA